MAHNDDDEPTRVISDFPELTGDDDVPTGVANIDERTIPSMKTLAARGAALDPDETDDQGMTEQVSERTMELPDLRARIAAVKAARENKPPVPPAGVVGHASEEATMITDSLKSRLAGTKGDDVEDVRRIIREDELQKSIQSLSAPLPQAPSRSSSAREVSSPPRRDRGSMPPKPPKPRAPGALPPSPAEKRGPSSSPAKPASEPEHSEQEVATQPVPLLPHVEEESRADITGIIPDLNLSRKRAPAFVKDRDQVENPFAASVSGFYSLPDITDDDISTGIPRTVTLAAIAATTLFACATVTSVCIREWWTPGDMLLWMTVVMSGVAAAGAGALLWQESTLVSIRAIISAATPAISAFIFGMLVALAWAVPPLRATAITLIGSEPTKIEGVFDDSSDRVALRACAEMSGVGDNPVWERVILTGATSKPRLATECLSYQEEGVRVVLAQGLADRWSKELANEEGAWSVARSCDVAAAMSELPVEPDELDARLLVCSLSSPRSEVQQCCAHSLAGRIKDPAAWFSRIRIASESISSERTAIAIFSMVFHKKDLSAGQQALSSAANFEGPEAERVALESACNAALNGAWGVTRHFSPALEGKCAVDAGRLPGGREVWTDVCDDVTRRLQNRTAKPIEVLCESTRTALIGKATDTARALLHAAVRKESAERLEDGIALGAGFLEDSRPKFKKAGKSEELKRALLNQKSYGNQGVTPAFKRSDFGVKPPPGFD